MTVYVKSTTPHTGLYVMPRHDPLQALRLGRHAMAMRVIRRRWTPEAVRAVRQGAQALILMFCTVTTETGAQNTNREHWLATWATSNFAAPPHPPADSIDRTPTFFNR